MASLLEEKLALLKQIISVTVQQSSQALGYGSHRSGELASATVLEQPPRQQLPEPRRQRAQAPDRRLHASCEPERRASCTPTYLDVHAACGGLG